MRKEVKLNKKLALIFLIAFSVRVALLVKHHHTYFLSGLTQGLLARNIIMGRGLVAGEKESLFLCFIAGLREFF